MDYNSSQLCFTTLTASPGQHVVVEFSVLDTAEYFDFLTFFDGNLATLSSLIGDAWGDNDAFSPLKSTGDQFLVVFFTNGNDITASGYEAHFTSVPCEYM